MDLLTIINFKPLTDQHYYIPETNFPNTSRYSCFIYLLIKLQSTLPMRSPLLSSRLYLKVTFYCLGLENCIWIEPLSRGHLSYKATFSLSQRWPLNTNLTVLTLQVIQRQTLYCNSPCLRGYTLINLSVLKYPIKKQLNITKRCLRFKYKIIWHNL